MSDENIRPFPQRSGSDFGGPGDTESRLTRLETKIDFLATREDVQKLETLIERKLSSQLKWMLGVTVGAAATLIAAGIAVFMR